MVRPAGHAPATIRLISGDEVADKQIGFPGQFESEVNPVFQLLVGGRLQNGQVHVFTEIPGIGRDLGRIAPGIIANQHKCAAIGVGAGQVAECQGIGCHVQADGFHCANTTQRRHLRSVEHGRTEGFIIGDTTADPVRFEQRGNVLHRIEKTGHGRTRITGEQMHAAVDFQRALDQQFIAGKNFSAARFEEPRIDFHANQTPTTAWGSWRAFRWRPNAQSALLRQPAMGFLNPLN